MSSHPRRSCSAGGFFSRHTPATLKAGRARERTRRRCTTCQKQYKIDAVAEIESKLESNAGVFVVAYNGLTVLQAQELRKQLRECGAQMKVYKNNLVRIALENKEQPNLDEILAGPLAYVFFEEEPVSAAKVLKEFAKKSKGVLEIKGGISDGQAVTAAEVDAIAELPQQGPAAGSDRRSHQRLRSRHCCLRQRRFLWSRPHRSADLRAEGSLVGGLPAAA